MCAFTLEEEQSSCYVVEKHYDLTQLPGRLTASAALVLVERRALVVCSKQDRLRLRQIVLGFIFVLSTKFMRTALTLEFTRTCGV